MDHHEENQTSTLLQKPQAIHFVECVGKFLQVRYLILFKSKYNSSNFNN